MRRPAVFALALVLLCSTMFAPASAAPPKPSAPEFTVQLVNHIVTVPASVNPYNGQTTGPDYYDNWTIELSIKNQPYSYSVNGKPCHLYYLYQSKPHYSTNWTDHVYDCTFEEQSPDDNATHMFISEYTVDPQSNSDYTVIFLGERTYAPQDVGYKIDYQVKAVVGHDAQYMGWAGEHLLSMYRTALDGVAYDCSSDWSGIQTLTVTRENVDRNVTFFPLYTYPPDSTTSTPTELTQPSTATPLSSENENQFNLSLDQVTIAVMAVVIAVMAVGMVVLFRRTAKKPA